MSHAVNGKETSPKQAVVCGKDAAIKTNMENKMAFFFRNQEFLMC